MVSEVKGMINYVSGLVGTVFVIVKKVKGVVANIRSAWDSVLGLFDSNKWRELAETAQGIVETGIETGKSIFEQFKTMAKRLG